MSNKIKWYQPILWEENVQISKSSPFQSTLSLARGVEGFWRNLSPCMAEFKVTRRLDEHAFKVEPHTRVVTGIDWALMGVEIFLCLLVVPLLIMLIAKPIVRANNSFFLTQPAQVNAPSFTGGISVVPHVSPKSSEQLQNTLPVVSETLSTEPPLSKKLLSQLEESEEVPVIVSKPTSLSSVEAVSEKDQQTPKIAPLAPLAMIGEDIYPEVYNARDYQYFNELCLLIKSNHPNLDRVDQLIKLIGSMINYTKGSYESHSKPLLVFAVKKGNIEVIKRLVAAGAKDCIVREGQRCWNTALSEAVDEGRLEIVEYLLLQGADPLNSTALKDSAHSCLPGVIKRGNIKCVKLLFDYVKDPEKFANGYCYNESRTGLVNGCLMRQYKYREFTFAKVHPLIQAFNEDDPEIFELLLEKGADPSVLIGSVENPLAHWFLEAVKEGMEKIAESLLSKIPVDFQFPDTGNTLLHMMCAHKRDEYVQLLLKKGADPTIGI